MQFTGLQNIDAHGFGPFGVRPACQKNDIYILTKQTVLLQSEPWSLLQLLFLT